MRHITKPVIIMSNPTTMKPTVHMSMGPTLSGCLIAFAISFALVLELENLEFIFCDHEDANIELVKQVWLQEESARSLLKLDCELM